MSDLDAETTRNLARTIDASMFGLLGMAALGLLFDDEPHVLTAAELRRALDAAPPQTWHAYAVVTGYFNPELTTDQDVDARRARLALMARRDLCRWRRECPTRPESLARHRLDAEAIR